MPRALITGVTGQDGAYLSQFLLSQGYEVHGLVRRSASADVVDARLVWLGIRDQVKLHSGDLTDLASLIRAAASDGEQRSEVLLDRVVRSLLHVGLSLQDAADQPAEVARQRITDALARLDEVIHEIRDHLFRSRRSGGHSSG